MASPNTQQLRIVVLGYLVRGRYGGMAWHYLQYLKGFSQLGHDVYFVEDSTDQPFCHHPKREIQDTDPEPGLRFAEHALEGIGLGDRWAYFDAHTNRWLGPAAGKILEICRTAELLVNVSGWVNPMRPWLVEIPVRVYIDTDPAFTQVRHLTDPRLREEAWKHTAFLSFGENIGREGCRVPDDGIPWKNTRQPVTLDAWPATPGQPSGKLTTVLAWDSFGALEHGGVHYGMKCHSFDNLVDLPQQFGPIFELQSRLIPPPKLIELLKKGWVIEHAHDGVGDPFLYRDFIQRSKAELGIVKHGYVMTRCGWFSERSAAYLASGRPVLAQQTGFSDWLSADLGVLPFAGKEELSGAIDDLNSRYQQHCHAAREVAAQYFASDNVLNRLIELAMGSQPAPEAPASRKQRWPDATKVQTRQQPDRRETHSASVDALSQPGQSAFELALAAYAPYLQQRMPNYNLGPHFLHRLRQVQGKLRMLALGASSVVWALEFARSEAGKLSLQLIDPSPDELRLVQKAAQYEGIRAEVKTCELKSADLEPGSFDVVVTGGALSQTRPVAALIRRIHRSLSPGGELWLVGERLSPDSPNLDAQAWAIAQAVFSSLPARLRKNHATNQVDAEIPGRPEQVSSNKINHEKNLLQLIEEAFESVEFVTYDAFLSLLLGFPYGPNYDSAKALDRNLIELIARMDQEFVKREVLSPSILIGIFRRRES